MEHHENNRHLQEYQLVQRALHGDQQAWEYLYSDTYKNLQRYARSLAQKHNASYIDCDNIVAESLFRCHIKLHTFTGQSLFGTWACGFVRNLFNNEYKKHCRQERIAARHNREIYYFSECSYYSGNPLDILILRERQEAVRRSFECLNTMQNFLLMEACVNKQPLTAIAKQLKHSYEYTRKQYHETRKLFSECFHIYYHKFDL